MMKNIKNFLLIILYFVSLYPLCVSASEVSQFGYNQDTGYVYFEGQLDESNTGSYVTLLVKNDDGVGYINQYKVNDDGSYYGKFQLSDDLKNYKVSLKAGNSDVTDTISAMYTHELFQVLSLEVVNENGSVFLENSDDIYLSALIKNKYTDENDTLLDVKISSEYSVKFDEIESKQEFEYGEIPVSATRVKAFAWENESTLVPLAEPYNAHINDMTFGSDYEKVVVAFLGDSISHSGVQQRFIESYYKNKYPDRDVVFINKGINGDMADRVIDRFDYEIMADKYSPAPQEAAIMIGMNDIHRQFYGENSTYTEEQKSAKIEFCLENIEKIINLCKENNITLTLVTPSLYDDDASFENGDTNNAIGANAALGKVGEGMKALAEKYNLPLIDLHTATNNWTKAIREISPGVQAITNVDRIHPDNFGGFVMGYEFVKQQGNSSIVASVDIDVETVTANVENAKVTNLSANKSKVSYTYKANSLPVAYNESYQKAESYNIPVTQDINNEIIKVTGLDEGTYTIKMNDTALTQTYTAAELAEGVNIAIDMNNPGQITALKVDEKVIEKATKEKAYRQIPSMESVIVRLKDTCNTGISNREDVAAYLADPDNVEAFLSSDYIVNSGTVNFYRNNINTYNSIKPNQAEEWAAIENLDAQANALAITEIISVVIEKQQ